MRTTWSHISAVSGGARLHVSSAVLTLSIYILRSILLPGPDQGKSLPHAAYRSSAATDAASSCRAHI